MRSLLENLMRIMEDIMEINIDKTYLGCFGKPLRHLKPTAIVVHHSCTRSPKNTRDVLNHKNCSTHFEIDMDGTIYQYREETYRCAHCCAANSYAIGIDCTHMDGKPFSEVQIESLNNLLSYLCDKWNIPKEFHDKLKGTDFKGVPGVFTHRALSPTKCPGDNFPVDKISIN